MALTKAKYVERVRGRALELGVRIDPKLIGYSMGDALDDLADEVWDAGLPLLQSDFTIPMVGGVAALSAASGAFMSNILMRSIRNVRGATDAFEWQKVPTRARLADEKTPLGRIWFTIEANSIIAMNDDGTTAPADQNVIFEAHYSAVIGSVPLELENTLIEKGVNHAARPPDGEVES